MVLYKYPLYKNHARPANHGSRGALRSSFWLHTLECILTLAKSIDDETEKQLRNYRDGQWTNAQLDIDWRRSSNVNVVNSRIIYTKENSRSSSEARTSIKMVVRDENSRLSRYFRLVVP